MVFIQLSAFCLLKLDFTETILSIKNKEKKNLLIVHLTPMQTQLHTHAAAISIALIQ